MSEIPDKRRAAAERAVRALIREHGAQEAFEISSIVTMLCALAIDLRPQETRRWMGQTKRDLLRLLAEEQVAVASRLAPAPATKQ